MVGDLDLAAGSAVTAAAGAAAVAAFLGLLNEAAARSGTTFDTAVSSPASAVHSVRVVLDRGARAQRRGPEFASQRLPGWSDATIAEW